MMLYEKATSENWSREKLIETIALLENELSHEESVANKFKTLYEVEKDLCGFGRRLCPICGKLLMVLKRGRYPYHGPYINPCKSSGKLFDGPNKSDAELLEQARRIAKTCVPNNTWSPSTEWDTAE